MVRGGGIRIPISPDPESFSTAVQELRRSFAFNR